MNDNAYGILGLKARPTDMGRPFVEVLKELPDVCRILASAFDLSHLPNRAELRAEENGQGDRLHAVARPRQPKPPDRRDAVFQGSHPRRTARRSASGCAIAWRRWGKWLPRSRTR